MGAPAEVGHRSGHLSVHLSANLSATCQRCQLGAGGSISTVQGMDSHPALTPHRSPTADGLPLPQQTLPLQQQVLPLQQQAPFRYVDQLLDLDAVQRRARLQLALNAGQHRYSEAAHLPGHLLIEAMAQASGVLLRRLTVGEAGGFLVGLEDARLPAEVGFPAQLCIDVSLDSANPPFFGFAAVVSLSGSNTPLARASLQVMAKRSFV